MQKPANPHLTIQVTLRPKPLVVPKQVTRLVLALSFHRRHLVQARMHC